MTGLQFWGLLGLAGVAVMGVRVPRHFSRGVFRLRSYTGKVIGEYDRSGEPTIFWSLHAAQLATFAFLVFVFASLAFGS
jgi:hypothetical protein